MKAQNAGPGRKIYNKQYYLGVLKKKNQVLSSEVAKFKQDIQNINKDNSQYIILEKEYDGLINEVRKLEGELADYNLAQDKFRAGTKVEDIMALFHHIKSQNDKKKQQLDELFIERKEMENEFNDINSEINRINAANEEKVNELDPDKREQYN